MEESRKKDKKLHAYSIELMTKKALEGVRSPSAHSVRSASVSNARSSGVHCSANRHKQTKQPEIIFLDDSEANGIRNFAQKDSGIDIGNKSGGKGDSHVEFITRLYTL